MRIVLITDWHSENMGYSDNFMPKALASLGHEVHLVTSNGQVYFNSSAYEDIFQPFLGPRFVACGVKEINGYTLHRLPHRICRGRVVINGLFAKLRSLRPDIVQAGEFICLSTYQAALIKPLLGYKLFVECHVHASVFPPAIRKGNIKERLTLAIYKTTVGRLVNYMCERCFPISSDAADIAVRFLGMKKNKVTIRPLGVDTDIFRPVSDDESMRLRLEVRNRLGFSDSDIVCIYTGRISKSKGSLCLAQAIGRLVKEGQSFKGLFVGNGTKKEVDEILSYPGCKVHPFVLNQELPQFYWASDAAVWPKQESTSQLDAASCGLPIILSNRIKVHERIDGNGLLYEEDDICDLAAKIQFMADGQKRRQMGECGVKKMNEFFSWKRLARDYIRDYEMALGH